MKTAALLFVLATTACAAVPVFREHTVATGLKGGYQVTAVDMNRDGKPDLLVVASGLDELIWFENPTWERHVLAAGFAGMINAAAYDLDGDGIPEVALAHGFSMQADKSAGIVSLVEHRRDPKAPWAVRDIDRIPTSHRLRWADIDGSGRKVLVNAPLTGAAARAPDYRDRVPLVYYDPADWKRRLIGDENEGVTHGITVDGNAILTASFSGIHRYALGADRKWMREEIARGDPAPWPKSGASDVAVGTVGGGRVLGSVEPWHGNQVVVYNRRGGSWRRSVIDDTLDDTHFITSADLDGDGDSEFVVAQRGKPYRVLVYRAERGWWRRTVVDDGGVAAASCATADLNGDGRIDIACVGSATANLKWYENRGAAPKP